VTSVHQDSRWTKLYAFAADLYTDDGGYAFSEAERLNDAEWVALVPAELADQLAEALRWIADWPHDNMNRASVRKVARSALARYHQGETNGTPNGGEHCAPPGGPHNTCYRHPDGSCESCGYHQTEEERDRGC
jgi:hypothetical protein